MKKGILAAIAIIIIWVGTSAAWYNAGTVSASKSEKGNAPTNAIDENFSTQWTCRGYKEECWFQVDIGFVGGDNEVFLAWKQPYQGTRTTYFDIRTSIDGLTWTTVFSGNSNDYSQDIGYTPNSVYNFPWTEFRYLRVVGHGNDVSDHNSLIEFQWDEPEDYFALTKRTPAAITASSYNKANTPARAIDKNLATHWTAEAGEWLQVDLGVMRTIEFAKIAWLSGDKRKADFDIEVSEDGVNWNLVFQGESAGKTKALEGYRLDYDSCARYVRVTGWGNNDPTQGTKNSITEIEVYGRDWYPGGNDCEAYLDEIGAVAGRM